MKKYFSLFFLSMITLFFVGCDVNNDVDNDTYPAVLEIKNESFDYDSVYGYFIYKEFTSPLYSADVVLIYRQSGTSNSNPVWQLIPRTLYLTQGELDYDYDFTVNDIMIYAGGNYDISTTPQYLTNQTFRVVLVPASGKNSKVDYEDYDSVIRYYNIDDSKIKTL